MIRTMLDLVKRAELLKPKVMVVAAAHDHPVLEAVVMAKDAKLIEPILIGDKQEIEKILHELHAKMSDYQIIDEKDLVKASEEAVKLVSSGKGDILMKGFVDTSVILRAALDKEFGLRTPNRISHVSVMEIPAYHKLLMMSDGAMNIDPNVDIKQEIIENGVEVLHAIGVKHPKVGMIAAIEKVNPKMQATLDAVELIERNRNERIKGCTIGGPFALDNAINQEAAMHKGVTDPMAGDVDFIVMPQIESGNVFYKSMMFLAGAKSASVIAGARKPIVLTSRADSKESKFYSIALSCLIAEAK
ncbi:MAG: phosphate butyryltransferase [Tenericutes bacterium GWC2_34_14]|nr:MAG: phosphate butyryltransferase [Tenericutes bacterium GWA2_35_7]OHE30053.1 MAG: phosphate butyryltransferase [Tenericutes bacterium GWC2_34_14]OHE35032.1 MAG: phosphate butyryltransferase [Tenericutes bacterium GWE2_34_108]OHE37108.1 MAG: phosphate butyryltransferase [Tenericutes bacterium GWF1_35_14]OHE39760.1 MAG: phosphate butyryltransferase [Tenericutes bacterium GWF2_35_184]OHE43986.1 MAG: phosphate butyryltransferase [Tenericutes bacterium RIFOXYA12_FULL_35_10]OHE44052.1 MAG: phos